MATPISSRIAFVRTRIYHVKVSLGVALRKRVHMRSRYNLAGYTCGHSGVSGPSLPHPLHFPRCQDSLVFVEVSAGRFKIRLPGGVDITVLARRGHTDREKLPFLQDCFYSTCVGDARRLEPPSKKGGRGHLLSPCAHDGYNSGPHYRVTPDHSQGRT